MLSKKTITCQVAGKEVYFETGRLARQADAAVLARTGDTVVLATVVMSDKAREGINYFPLLVDYEERLYAAGKIKGSRWIKREGRASDDAILRGRVIDRTLRPLFPEGMRNDVQVVVTVLCVDGENEADMLAVTASSMALELSGVPFGGPVAGVRVGKIGSEFVVNPSQSQQKDSVMDLIVCGTGEHIMMVEAGAKLVSEEDIIEGVKLAQRELHAFIQVQQEFRAQAGKPAREAIFIQPHQGIVEIITASLTEDRIEQAVYVQDKASREERINALFAALTLEVKEKLGELEGVNMEREVWDAADKILKKYQQKQILQHERRVDGRRLDETREVTCEVGVLPRTHGSALFTRGETQVLTVATLGSKGDEQLLDGIDDPVEGTPKRYIHHYNMPGYSVGEVTPLRGPGRREIGHGALAERAISQAGVLPEQEAFPYTIRLVSEAIASNGSTSMASTCGSTLALMDAGVPVSQVIGGVAMGLVMDESNPQNFKVLTDIAGIEDFNGHMDFKVTGSETGVSALQLDIKVRGLTPEILAEALMKARPGRLHIISKMRAVLPAPRPEMSPYAPRITSFYIKPDKIREVIGSGGKIINAIIAETGVKIDIEDSGLVMVCSSDAAASEKAVQWIQNLVKEVAVGEVYEGKVTRLMDFGAFVEVLPGKEGLVHISQLANYRVAKVEDVVQVGDSLKVRVSEIDDQGRINLTHKPFAPAATPEQLSAGERGARGFDWKPNGHSAASRLGHGRPNRQTPSSRFMGPKRDAF